jgi:chemotaxis protein CheX
MTSKSNFAEFSKPFIDAAKAVFETMVFSKLEPQKPYLKTDSISKGDISAVIGLTGTIKKDNITKEYKAMLVISFPLDTYLKVASAMLGDTYSTFTEEISDVGSEICNMVMGNAKRDLIPFGYTCSMAIPSMIRGKDHSIKYPNNTLIIVIPVVLAHGPMFMEICYKED